LDTRMSETQQEAAPQPAILIPGSWAWYVANGLPLIDDDGTFISQRLRVPISEYQPPVDAILIAKDWGKNAHKGGGIDHNFHFHSTVVVDAYCRARDIDRSAQEFQDPQAQPWEALATWRVFHHIDQASGDEVGFWLGRHAVPFTAELPITKTAMRIDDSRSQDMLLASTVMDLIGLGLQPTVMEVDMEVTQVHKIVLALGLPLRDVRSNETARAVESLKGLHIVERTDASSGIKQLWHIEIVSVVVIPQTRGSLTAATRTLRNRWAYTKKRVFRVRDIGAGDIHEYGVDATGFSGKRLGDGLVKLATTLRELVEEKYGIHLSMAEAQLALRTRRITKAGEPFDISPLWPSLKADIDGILTLIGDIREIKTTFIVFTGGGAALLGREIRAMMTEGYHLVEGEDFLILPENIAEIANVIGLFASGMNEILRLIEKYVRTYMALKQQKASVLETIRLSSRQGAQNGSGNLETAQQSLREIDDQLRHHVGAYYSDVEAALVAAQSAQAVS
jgi:hypothetical protein